MKKIALLLALLLCVCSVAVADVSSKTGEDVYGSSTVILYISVAEDRQEEAAEEAQRMGTAASFDDYFDAIDVDGNKVVLAEIPEIQPVTVYEFVPVNAINYEESMGDITAIFAMATPYDEGEKLVILIGFTNEDDPEKVDWFAFDGVGVVYEGVPGIQFTLTPEIVERIQEEGCFFAVASKTKY